MPPIAFTLRDDYVGTVTQYETQADLENETGTEVPLFLGGVVAVGDSDVNIAELLEEGDGVIVVEETNAPLVLALDEYPALKRTAVPEGAAITGGYQDQPATALKAELKRRGIAGAGSTGKDGLVAALERIDELNAQSINVADGTTLTELMAETDAQADEADTTDHGDDA